MKVVRAYKEGDTIPTGAKYLYTDKVFVGYGEPAHYLLDPPQYYERRFYYEIDTKDSIEPGTVEHPDG